MEPIKTEPIKQEIINNIFENGDKLITGPILQTVLIDMIDDVNVKDQEILSKTGSWDDAAIQIPNLATKGELNEAKNNLQGNITSLSESVARDLENVDLTGYATETWVESQGYLKEHQDISGLATKSELTSVSESVQTDITNLSESVANSAVWQKGTGEDSIVQKLPAVSTVGVYSTPTATVTGAIATGYSKASGYLSHAEGYNTLAEGSDSHAEGGGTKALGDDSHAEGSYSKASGNGSHAEGDHTIASNNYEHAQGMFNHSSENQIFSVGVGEMTPSFEITRRNAISVLAVNNNGSHTASFFVQNVGGYDGTNPTPGTNDLATVLNNTETWTFTLEDGSTVTKTIRIV